MDGRCLSRHGRGGIVPAVAVGFGVQALRQHQGGNQCLVGATTLVTQNVGADTKIGDVLTLEFAFASHLISGLTMTDPAGNVWVKDKRTSAIGLGGTEVWSAPCTGVIANGATVTLNLSAAGAAISSLESWVNTGTPFDSTGTGNGTGFSATGSDNVINAAGALVIAVLGTVDAPADGQVVGAVAGWNVLRDIDHTLANCHLNAAYTIVGAAGVQTYNPSLAVSIGWTMALDALPPFGGGGLVSGSPQRSGLVGRGKLGMRG